MRPEPVKITLGDKEFTIKPLTLRQIREIDKILRNLDITEIEKTSEILRVGLSRDYPEDAKNLEDLEIPMVDLGPICRQILTVGGMTVVEGGNGQPVPTPGT